VQYRLAETFVNVAGEVDWVNDAFGGNGQETQVTASSAATVTIAQRADPTPDALCTIVAKHWGSDDDFAVQFTGDGRLASISYKVEGAGGQIVTAAAKTIAVVGGIAAAIAGVAHGRLPLGSAMAASVAPTQPEQAARSAWEAEHQTEVSLRKQYTSTLANAANRLAEVRDQAVSATDLKTAKETLALAGCLQQLFTDCQKELDTIDALYKAWRATTKSTRTESCAYDLRLSELPSAAPGKAPVVGSLTDTAKVVWQSMGVVVTVDRGHSNVGATPHQRQGDDGDARHISWRIPRPVRFWVWRRGMNGKPVLQGTFTVSIVDERSEVAGVALKSELFGSHSGELTFGDLGAPEKMAWGDKSTAAAFATALSGVPETVAGGLDTASKMQSSFTGLLDAEEERRLTALKRRVDMMNETLEMKGIAATADDFAELKRLEQRVAIAEARAKL
jgi:hypothetical protein